MLNQFVPFDIDVSFIKQKKIKKRHTSITNVFINYKMVCIFLLHLCMETNNGSEC